MVLPLLQMGQRLAKRWDAPHEVGEGEGQVLLSEPGSVWIAIVF